MRYSIESQKWNTSTCIHTAATHTTIDSNILYLAGYELRNALAKVEVETANGIIVNEIYELKKLNCLGMSKTNFKVQVYDFIAHGITTEYDGVIGLDFLREIVLTIDFKDYKIIIQKINPFT